MSDQSFRSRITAGSISHLTDVSVERIGYCIISENSRTSNDPEATYTFFTEQGDFHVTPKTEFIPIIKGLNAALSMKNMYLANARVSEGVIMSGDLYRDT